CDLGGEGHRGDDVLISVAVHVHIQWVVLTEFEAPLPVAELAVGPATVELDVHRRLVHRGELPLLLGQVHVTGVERFGLGDVGSVELLLDSVVSLDALLGEDSGPAPEQPAAPASSTAATTMTDLAHVPSSGSPVQTNSS